MAAIRVGVLLSLALALCSYSCVRAWKYWKHLKAWRITLDFSEVPPLHDFNISKTSPYPVGYRPWKAGKYNMTMGIRKMPEEDWLIIDNMYEKEQEFRRHLIKNNRDGVMQCLPGAEGACEEALEYIVKFLTRRYPSQFWLLKDRQGYVYNAITSKTFRFTAPYEQHPLEIAAQLAMEDINLLMQGTGDNPDEYYLQASFSMAPAGWNIQQRIGWPLWSRMIHGPVPLWDVKLRKAMEKFFLGLKVSNPVQRSTYFMQTNAVIFQQEPFTDSVELPLKIEDIRIRHERQTLRRLPRSSAIIFLVRTYLTPITGLRDEKDSLFALRSAINAWPSDIAKYKGKHVWHEVFEKWCDEVLGDFTPQGGEV